MPFIEAISLNFEKGMTVLTGETGAGKSIIIDAMNMDVGSSCDDRCYSLWCAKRQRLRGFSQLRIVAFYRKFFDEQGLEMGDEIIIRREILQNGRSISRVNGQMVNLSVLRAIGQHLVDIHGQHDQEELMRPQLHIQMLDEFGDVSFWDLKKPIRRVLMPTVKCVSRFWKSRKTNKNIRHVSKCWNFKWQRLRQQTCKQVKTWL